MTVLVKLQKKVTTAKRFKINTLKNMRLGMLLQKQYPAENYY